MLKRVASRAMWLTRGAALFGGAVVTLALVLGVATVALGANGGNFILGQGNAATALTRLTGNVNGSTLQVVNNNAETNDTALDLRVQTGEEPMRVNSNDKVANLNADFLDGLGSSTFMRSVTYDTQSTLSAGTDLGDGTFEKTASCISGDKLLSGGPVDVANTSTLLESYPVDTTQWKARIDKNGVTDDFRVRVLCADQ